LCRARGLVPVLALAERVGLRRLVDERVTVPTDRGSHTGSKVSSLVTGMVAGADSIEDMHLRRHGGMGRLFTGAYAPSTLGSFLRCFRFGHVRQLDAVAARLAANLAARTPLLPGAGQIAYLDVDDTIRQTYGYAKQGAGYGYTGVKGLNALLATLSTPTAAPVIERPHKTSVVGEGSMTDRVWSPRPCDLSVPMPRAVSHIDQFPNRFGRTGSGRRCPPECTSGLNAPAPAGGPS
jgi:hypothetical protein